jgi:hypothetical protein
MIDRLKTMLELTGFLVLDVVVALQPVILCTLDLVKL